MGTAKRIALILTGTAVMIAAIATPGARADRGWKDDNGITAMTAAQRATPQRLPGRIDYALGLRTISVASSVDHLTEAPAVANLDRGQAWAMSELASASKSDRIDEKSVTTSATCDRDTFASQQLNASDGGRGSRVATALGDVSCPSQDAQQHRMRQVLLDESLDLSVQKSEPTLALVKFEAVISINLAALSW